MSWFEHVPTAWKVALALAAAFVAGASTVQFVSEQKSLPSQIAELRASMRDQSETIRDLALQVCLLRVEVRREPTTDRCAGLR